MANMNNVALLLRDDIVTVQVAFNKDAASEYTFVCEKVIAERLDIGDEVVIKGNRNFFQVAVVRQVDKECDVDVSAGYNYGWIVQKVDAERYNYNMEQTEKVTEELKKRQRDSYRKQVLQSIGLEDLKKLEG